MTNSNETSFMTETESDSMENYFGYKNRDYMTILEAKQLVEQFSQLDLKRSKKLFNMITSLLQLYGDAAYVKAPNYKQGDSEQRKHIMLKFLDEVLQVGVHDMMWPMEAKKKYPLNHTHNETFGSAASTQSSASCMSTRNISAERNVMPLETPILWPQGMAPNQAGTFLSPPPGISVEGLNQCNVPRVKHQVAPPQMVQELPAQVNAQTTVSAAENTKLLEGMCAQFASALERIQEREHSRANDAMQIQLFSNIYEKFDGTEPARFNSWATKVKQRLDLCKVSDAVALAHIQNNLSGVALQTYSMATDRVKESLSETWKFLSARFELQKGNTAAHMKFHTAVYSPAQPITQFYAELESCCPLQREDKGFEEFMLLKLVEALKGTEFLSLVCQTQTDPNRKKGDLGILIAKIDKIQRGRIAEKSCRGDQQSQVNQQQMQQNQFCEFCKTHTHWTSDCRTKQRAERQAGSGYVNAICESYRRPVPTCYICKVEGHISTQCPVQKAKAASGCQGVKANAQSSQAREQRTMQGQAKVSAVSEQRAQDYMVNGIVVREHERLLDSGSVPSFVAPSFVSELQAKGQQLCVSLCDCAFKSFSDTPVECEGTVKLGVSLATGECAFVEFHISKHVEKDSHKLLIGRRLLQRLGIELRDKHGNVHKAKSSQARVNVIEKKNEMAESDLTGQAKNNKKSAKTHCKYKPEQKRKHKAILISKSKSRVSERAQTQKGSLGSLGKSLLLTLANLCAMVMLVLKFVKPTQLKVHCETSPTEQKFMPSNKQLDLIESEKKPTKIEEWNNHYDYENPNFDSKNDMKLSKTKKELAGS